MSDPDLTAAQLSRQLLSRAAPTRMPVKWHAARVTSLASAARNEDGWTAGIARIQLLASQEAYGEAEHEFAALLASSSADFAQPTIFTQIVIAALALQRLDIIATMLNAHKAAPPDNQICFSPLPSHPMRAEFCLHRDGGCTWLVSASLPGGEAAHRFTASLIAMMELLSRYVQSPDKLPGRVALSLGDMATHGGLGYSSFDPSVFLVPDSHFIHSRGYQSLRESFTEHDLPWTERRRVAFWRGATTGFRAPPDRSWKSLQRIKLCQLSLTQPELIDAGITSIAQSANPSEAAEIAAAGLLRAAESPEHFLHYRYQIDIDGNSNAWQGLFMKLLSGSVVLKVASPHGFRQWYYDRLRPWVNYVPVAADLSDLMAAIAVLRADDAFARTIGMAGRELARSLDFESELAAACHTVRRAMASGTRMQGTAA